MANFNSYIKKQKNFISRNHSLTYDASFEIQNKDLKLLLSTLVEILKPILKINTLIKDIKGRDRLNVINSKLELPFDQELLSCDFLWKPAQFGLVETEEQSELLASYYILSPFDHFEAKSVFHKVESQLTSFRPGEILLETILKDDRFNLQSFRIGLDYYGLSSFANWFFTTPVVLEGLLIEVNKDQFKLRLQSEGNSALSESFKDENSFLNKLLVEIGRFENINLLADIKLKIESR